MKQTVFKKIILTLILCLLVAFGIFALYKNIWQSSGPITKDESIPYSRGPSGPPVIGEPTLPLPE